MKIFKIINETSSRTTWMKNQSVTPSNKGRIQYNKAPLHANICTFEIPKTTPINSGYSDHWISISSRIKDCIRENLSPFSCNGSQDMRGWNKWCHALHKWSFGPEVKDKIKVTVPNRRSENVLMFNYARKKVTNQNFAHKEIKIKTIFLKCLTVDVGLICCPETPVTNYRPT